MISGLVRDFEKLLGSSSVLYQPEDLLLYEYDGSVEKGRPDVVVFPTTTEHVSRIVQLAAKHDLPVVGRGAGTGLSGGALARTRSPTASPPITSPLSSLSFPAARLFASAASMAMRPVTTSLASSSAQKAHSLSSRKSP